VRHPEVAHYKSTQTPPGSRRHLAAWAILTLVSGAFMVWAGYVFATGRISTGLWITTPPGFTIQAAFGLIRRHDRAAGRSAQSLKVRVGQELTILLAGGVMVGAGYAGAVLNWLVAIPIIISGAPVIGAALWLGRRHPPIVHADPEVDQPETR
jgi:hypothetical protein